MSPPHQVSPQPDAEEAAAIAAALSVVLSQGPAAGPELTPRWRFSGRWWSKPVPARRSRP